MYLRGRGADSLYPCPYPITVSTISKCDCILKFCSDFPRMNFPYLKSSEQPNHLFTGSHHKIRFYIFQNISKCWIHGLKPFK